MLKAFVFVVFFTLLTFGLLAWYGSTIPDETYQQKLAKIHQVCSTEFNPQQCELTEIARIIDKQQADHQKYLDQQVGN